MMEKHFERTVIIILVIAIIITIICVAVAPLFQDKPRVEPEYVSMLFDTSRVHTLDIEIDNWESFRKNAMAEEYTAANVTIDGERLRNVGFRAKGNSSLVTIGMMGGERFGFKIEFDRFVDGQSYHGLDKLSLNNIYMDKSYLKDYVAYRLMAEAGVPAPLVSFIFITVNGEDFGLYLACEAIEDSFLDRSFGGEETHLYKPDAAGIGRGEGMVKVAEQVFEALAEALEEVGEDGSALREIDASSLGSVDMSSLGDIDFSSMSDMEKLEDIDLSKYSFIIETLTGIKYEKLLELGEGLTKIDYKKLLDNFNFAAIAIEEDDLCLLYTDDRYSSYKNIFSSAKTPPTNYDKDRVITALKRITAEKDLEKALDTDEVIRYFAAHNFILNGDSYTGSVVHNYYLREHAGRLSMLPWDYNLGFGGYMYNVTTNEVVNYPIDEPLLGGELERRPMLRWILTDDEYREQYHRVYLELIESYFESGRFEREIEAVTELITPYVRRDPTKFCTFEDFLAGSEAMKEFCTLRAESIRRQIEGGEPVDAGELDYKKMGVMSIGLDTIDFESMGIDREQIDSSSGGEE